jgi:hypothetical protein
MIRRLSSKLIALYVSLCLMFNIVFKLWLVILFPLRSIHNCRLFSLYLPEPQLLDTHQRTLGLFISTRTRK